MTKCWNTEGQRCPKGAACHYPLQCARATNAVLAQQRRAQLLGEMWGDRAVQAPFALIAGQANLAGKVARTKIGGVIIADMCTTANWERWQGTAILIPTQIDFAPSTSVERIDQMMTNHLGDSDYWRPAWHAKD